MNIGRTGQHFLSFAIILTLVITLLFYPSLQIYKKNNSEYSFQFLDSTNSAKHAIPFRKNFLYSSHAAGTQWNFGNRIYLTLILILQIASQKSYAHIHSQTLYLINKISLYLSLDAQQLMK